MNKKDRFFATIERRPVDRPAAWLGIPATSALPRLFSHFQATDIAGLKQAVGDDIWLISLGRIRAHTFQWKNVGLW